MLYLVSLNHQKVSKTLLEVMREIVILILAERDQA